MGAWGLLSWPWLFKAGAMSRSWPFTLLHRHVPFLSNPLHLGAISG
jgi:hypothetical protein